MIGIADTGLLVAFANRTDRYHDWTTGLAARVTKPFLAGEAVLAEAAFHLGSVPTVLAVIREGLIESAFVADDHLIQLAELADRYADRRPDLADIRLIRMGELYPRHPVITVDRADFHVYRRNKREMIPLICPPA